MTPLAHHGGGVKAVWRRGPEGCPHRSAFTAAEERRATLALKQRLVAGIGFEIKLLAGNHGEPQSIPVQPVAEICLVRDYRHPCRHELNHIISELITCWHAAFNVKLAQRFVCLAAHPSLRSPRLWERIEERERAWQVSLSGWLFAMPVSNGSDWPCKDLPWAH